MNTGELNRLEALVQLIAELDRIHPNGSFDPSSLRDERGMPDFVTTKNGYHREFGSAARLAVLALVNAWSNEVPSLSIRVELRALATLLHHLVLRGGAGMAVVKRWENHWPCYSWLDQLVCRTPLVRDHHFVLHLAFYGGQDSVSGHKQHDGTASG